MKVMKVLVCNPVRMGPPETAARKRRCDVCGDPIWVARSSPKTARRYCFPCAKDLIPADAKFEPLTAKQLADVKSKMV